MNNKYFNLRNINADYYKQFQIPKYLENLLTANKAKFILDYGCGLGQLTSALHNKKYKVIGMDISEESLAEFKKKKINFVKINNLNYQKKKFKDKFDLIILNHVLEHQKKEEIILFLKDLKYMLKNNGLLFIAVPNAQSLTGVYWRYEDFTHQTLFTSGSLYYVLKASGFQKVEFIDIYATQNLNIITGTIRLLALKLVEIILPIIFKITGNGYHTPSKNIFTFEIKCVAKKKYISSYVSNYLLDLSKSKNIKKIINIKPDYIFYAVSLNHNESEINFEKTINTNFVNLALILDNKKFTKNLKAINYISTAQVYGSNTKIYSENIMANPLNKYAFTHYLCEEYLRFFYLKNKINTNIFRISNTYGPPILKNTNCWWPAFNNFCFTSFYKSTITIDSHGHQKRDFIFICDAIKKILGKSFKKKGCCIYNIGSNNSKTILEIANKIKKVAQKILKKKIILNVKQKKPQHFKSNFVFRSNYFKKSIISNTNSHIIKTLNYLAEWK